MDDAPSTETIPTNGIRLHAVQAGPVDGPLVILLHGFPEDHSCWRHQVGPLAGAGLRVLTPDQRGYGPSDKPEGVASYRLDTLAADVLGLIDADGRAKARLVGHDWGGIVAWWVAINHPDRVERLAILNAPHPVAARHFFATHPLQWLRSWYVFFFQIPRLPEANFRRGDWSPLVQGLRGSSRPGAFDVEDIARLKRAWSEPGAIRAMIHWYRALLRHPPRAPAEPRVRVPTLILWGDRDRFIGRGAADASLQYCDQGRLERFPEATHWLHREEPDRVNRLLIDFLAPVAG